MSTPKPGTWHGFFAHSGLGSSVIDSEILTLLIGLISFLNLVPVQLLFKLSGHAQGHKFPQSSTSVSVPSKGHLGERHRNFPELVESLMRPLQAQPDKRVTSAASDAEAIFLVQNRL